ncbi:MAG: hypothetical protein WCE45_10690 [Sedimentisphaerales bacterium]
MITEKTVFILGAGASCPYGFPSGTQLREDICFKFEEIYSRYASGIWKDDNALENVEKPIRTFIEKFNNSTTKSIDLFMAGNPTLVKTGKYIISFNILNAERKSSFRESSPKRNQDWYSYLFNRMREGVIFKKDLNKFSENNVSFITFNYDRSLEIFFYESLCNSFSEVLEQEIIKILNQLKIIHVYGSIAPLEWQKDQEGIKYRTPISEQILQKTSENLKTIYEEIKNPELDEAKKLIVEAEKVFFLGFGYASENMGILELPETIPYYSKVYGTAFGLESKEISDIKNNIIRNLEPRAEKERKNLNYDYNRRIRIEDMDCLKLLRNYL